jgi:hypothetical protein
MADTLKQYGLMLLGLMIALILLQTLLNIFKRVPVVGGVAAEAQQLTQEGALS